MENKTENKTENTPISGAPQPESQKERNTGRLTPSGFKKMMTSGRGKDKELGDTAIKYAISIAKERIGVAKDEIWTKETQWGLDNEADALIAYEAHTGIMVQTCGHVVHPKFDFVGGTPDGFVGTDGIIEIKCPFNSDNHFGNLMFGLQIPDYDDQMQGYLWITGRQWCDFISYDPRYPKDLQLHVVRIERNQVRINEIEARALVAEKLIQEWLQIIKARQAGPNGGEN